MHVNKNGEKSPRLIVGYQLASYNSVGHLVMTALKSKVPNKQKSSKCKMHKIALLNFSTTEKSSLQSFGA